MDKNSIINALKLVREHSPKRNFKQKIDAIINLRGLNLKNVTHQVDLFVVMPHAPVKRRIGAFVGHELAEQAKGVCDIVTVNDEFKKYEGNKKAIKNLAKNADFFIAQATFMPQVAKTFGRIFGPRSLMPNPKAGCVVAPNANLKPVVERLQKTSRLQAKSQPVIKFIAGTQDMTDEDVAENILTVLLQLQSKLPQETANIKNILLKFTMGPAITVGASAEDVKARFKPEAAKAEENAPKDGKADTAGVNA